MRWGSLRSWGGAALWLLFQGQTVRSDLAIDVNSIDTLKDAGKAIAEPMMVFYDRNQTEGIPGKLTDTWYVAGAMFMTLIQYWQVSGDSQYNSIVSHDLMFQAGSNYDYFDSNYSQWLGNDDQMFWGLACITASETGFPEIKGKPTWTSLARAVFQMQIGRWDNPPACDGGITWQIHPWQAGYTLRNAISNGGLFQLAARLGRFTGNQTYLDWADKLWDWSVESPLINPAQNWLVADSTSGDNECADNDVMQWTYNYGTYLAGAAFMYNATDGDEKWLNRVNGLLGRTFDEFFPKGFNYVILSEYACEGNSVTPINCDRNMLGFKGWTAQWLAFVANLVPSTRDKILPKLQGSVAAIGRQCDGVTPEFQNLCGCRWWQNTWDGQYGLEVQMSALGGVTANLMLMTGAKAQTIATNPSAKEQYLDTYSDETPDALPKITTGDRVGSWILTVLWSGGIIAASWWLIKQK